MRVTLLCLAGLAMISVPTAGFAQATDGKVLPPRVEAPACESQLPKELCFEANRRIKMVDPAGEVKDMQMQACPGEYAMIGAGDGRLLCIKVGPYARLDYNKDGELEDVYVAAGRTELEQRGRTLSCRPGTFAVGQWDNGKRLACATITGMEPRENAEEYQASRGGDRLMLCSQKIDGRVLSAATGWHGAENFLRCRAFLLPAK